MSELKRQAARALACLDLTDLNDDCDKAAIDDLCQRANTPHGPVAAICIWPRFVAYARGRLASGIRIATVVNFPSGDEPAAQVIAMTEQAVRDGADEIDMVIPYGELLEGREARVIARVERVKRAAGLARVKAILETGLLGGDEIVRRAAELAIEGGADFIKTSTGKVPVNATPAAARVMLEVISEKNRDCGFKPAGGVRTTEDATLYLSLADEILGEGWATPERFRIGASGVLTALLATLDGEDAPENKAAY
jgi:deoxyribose-phosphate aldolase